MTEAEAWLLQARSDHAAAQRVLDRNDPSTYCQAVAKYQQAVEKCVKMLVASLVEQGFIRADSRPVDRGHLLTKHLKTLQRLPQPSREMLQSHVAFLLSDYRVGEIMALSLLAPAYPASGDLFQRNTEYPYNIDSQHDAWTAPAAAESYSLEADVDRFSRLTQAVARYSEDVYKLIRRQPA